MVGQNTRYSGQLHSSRSAMPYRSPQQELSELSTFNCTHIFTLHFNVKGTLRRSNSQHDCRSLQPSSHVLSPRLERMEFLPARYRCQSFSRRMIQSSGNTALCQKRTPISTDSYSSYPSSRMQTGGFNCR
jgi:hypothetical protein